MPPAPRAQTPYDPQSDDDYPEVRRDCAAPAHLTMRELAERWRRTPKTIERHYQEWGLRPLRFGGRLLFPFAQVLEVEQRAMRGELVAVGSEISSNESA